MFTVQLKAHDSRRRQVSELAALYEDIRATLCHGVGTVRPDCKEDLLQSSTLFECYLHSGEAHRQILVPTKLTSKLYGWILLIWRRCCCSSMAPSPSKKYHLSPCLTMRTLGFRGLLRLSKIEARRIVARTLDDQRSAVQKVYDDEERNAARISTSLIMTLAGGS